MFINNFQFSSISSDLIELIVNSVHHDHTYCKPRDDSTDNDDSDQLSSSLSIDRAPTDHEIIKKNAKNSSEKSDRHHHNDLERQRRRQMRSYYHALRKELPNTAANKQVSKETILNTATSHIHRLTAKEEKLAEEKKALRWKQAKLKKTLKKHKFSHHRQFHVTIIRILTI